MRAFVAGIAGLSGTVKQKPVLDATGVGAGVAAPVTRTITAMAGAQVVHRTGRAPS
jgi:hypothetical protein